MIDATEQESELIHPPARLLQSFMSRVTGPIGSAGEQTGESPETFRR